MDEKQFEHLKSYGAMLAIARQLLQCGLATPAEYHKIEGILSRKERPDAEPQRNIVPIRQNRVRKEETKKQLNLIT